MEKGIEIAIIIPLLVICIQFYFFSTNSTGRERQERCQKLGIGFMTLGVTSLVFRTVPFFMFGLIMMMLGFRLIARGLDRLDKKNYIDRYQDH
jgi:hypothetical protein